MSKIKTIAFETEAKRLYLLAKEILYIQAKGHDCHVYTISGDEYTIRLTMAQCARLIDESTYFTSSDFVLLGRNLIINYSRLGEYVFDDAEIPLRKGTRKNGQEEVVMVKCQNQAWKNFLDLLEKGKEAMDSYQQKKRETYIDTTLSKDCSLIGLMTTPQVIRQDYYELMSSNDFIILGGSNAYPIYTEGEKDPKLEEESRASQTVKDINKKMRHQPISLVNRAYKKDGTPKFDILFSYEPYEEDKFMQKPSERLKALQKKFNEFYESNIQKIISDSENKNGKEKTETLESLGLYDFIRDINRISQELSQQEDHPLCYRSRPLGQYRYQGRNGRPEIVLFLKNIYDAEQDWHCCYRYDEQLPTLEELVKLTYIHELMHAIMRSPKSYTYIEEPLAEMGMLCFVHDALRDETLEKKAKHWVEEKQKYEPICHYGFGAFLYESLYNAEVGWDVGNLMKQYIKVNKKLSEDDAALSDYEDYFLGGYPWHNLQMSALYKLFEVLGTKRIKKNITKSKDKEILFEWRSNISNSNDAISYEENADVSNKKSDESFELVTEVEDFLAGLYDDCEEMPQDHYETPTPRTSYEPLEDNIEGFNLDPNSNYKKYLYIRESSPYCHDIYVNCLRKKLKADKEKDFSDSIFWGASSIVLTRKVQDGHCHYELEIRF